MDNEYLQSYVEMLLQDHNPFPNKQMRQTRGPLVLQAFVYMVNNDIPPPKAVLDYVASGVKLHLDGSQSPWPTNRKRSVLPNTMALVQIIDARYPRHREQIAAHIGVSSRQVGSYVKRSSPEITLLRCIYDRKHEKSDLAGLLNDLSPEEYS